MNTTALGYGFLVLSFAFVSLPAFHLLFSIFVPSEGDLLGYELVKNLINESLHRISKDWDVPGAKASFYFASVSSFGLGITKV